MPFPSFLAEPIDGLRSRTDALLDRARAETMDLVAQLSGRSADWVDEAGHALADETIAATGQLATATGRYADRVAGRVASVVGRWSTALGDRMVRLGEDLVDLRRS